MGSPSSTPRIYILYENKNVHVERIIFLMKLGSNVFTKQYPNEQNQHRNCNVNISNCKFILLLLLYKHSQLKRLFLENQIKFWRKKQTNKRGTIKTIWNIGIITFVNIPYYIVYPWSDVSRFHWFQHETLLSNTSLSVWWGKLYLFKIY